MSIKEIKTAIHAELEKHADIKFAYKRGLRDNYTGIICGHSEGLPGDLNCAEIVSNFKEGDGDAMIVVTPSTVARYFISYPCNHNRWQCRDSIGYMTPGAMLIAVRGLMNPKAGCWGATTA
jgi:hypothetical protein